MSKKAHKHCECESTKVAEQQQVIDQQAAEIAALKTEIDALKGEITALKPKVGVPVRTRLPETRRAVTHKFQIGGHEGYMTIGLFPDGSPGELFVTMAKEGSTIGGLMDTVGCLTSIALQYGVGIETLARKFKHQRFEPSGFSTNREIGFSSSIIDYVFRWMELRFAPPPPSPEAAKAEDKPVEKPAEKTEVPRTDLPPCAKCGAIMQPSGRCHRCPNCGETSGCS